MSTQKNISSAYTIYSTNRNDPIVLDSNVVIIKGNLSITGNTTTISSTNTDIKDNKIVLNSGELGMGVTSGTSGIEIDRGLYEDVRLVWNESTTTWQVTNDGTSYFNIVSTTTGYTRLAEDPAPQLSFDLVTGPNKIISNTSVTVDPTLDFIIQGNVKLENQTTFPTAELGSNYLVAATPGTGGSGLYVVNASADQQELVTKSKAIVFSLIF